LIVEPIAVPQRLLRDETDSPVLGTALAGGAEILCTWDEDFYEQPVVAYCAERGIRIMSDIELLRDPEFAEKRADSNPD
jgi:predicted nucleic acid-binding protein